VATAIRAPLLVVFGGLPGTGKTSIARDVARLTGGFYLRIDSIEQVLRASEPLAGELNDRGYRISYAVAGDNLALGSLVVADSVNPIEQTREAWRQVALDSGSPLLEVEVVCSDIEEHRRRVEARSSDIPGLRLPTWEEVRTRKYDPWRSDHLVIDTARTPLAENVRHVLEAIDRLQAP
jgi:predicted kinase